MKVGLEMTSGAQTKESRSGASLTPMQMAVELSDLVGGDDPVDVFGEDSPRGERARRLRALPDCGPALKVIGLSGYARPADVEHGQREGFAHYFAKPVDPDELERAIAALLTPSVDAHPPTAGPPASAGA